MAKQERYRDCVKKVKGCAKNCNSSGKGARLLHCADCDEINLWSYWQGGETHLDAKILLVGQDWGPYDPQEYAESRIVKEIIENRKSNPTKYYSYTDGNDSITDKNLIELFNSIGYDITKDQPDLFFTNFVLCYREKNFSGDFKQVWADNCSEHFKELADIIQPNVILCLGRNVYESVLKVFGKTVPSESYNKIIDKHEPTAVDGHDFKIFPLAHCGGMGTSNRNRGKNTDKNDLLAQQKIDWGYIKNYL
jgi:hypothetical protein